MKKDFVDTELEREVLAAAMTDAAAFDEIAEILSPKHFANQANAKIFELILELRSQGIEPDIIALYNAANKRGYESLVTVKTLTEIAGMFGTAVNAKYNSAFLYELWTRREARKQITKFARDLERADDVFELFENAANALRELANPLSESEDGMQTLGEEMEDYFREIKAERESGREIGLRSKIFPTFNRTEGLRPGNIVAITGEYKSGKTTFAVALALDFALQDYGVGIVSLEMSKQAEVYPKIISMVSGTRYGYLRNPSQRNSSGMLRYSDEKFHETIRKASAKLSDKKIFVADKSFTIRKIEKLIRKWKEKKGVQIVFVDYIGLVETPRGERRDLELKALSRKLKLLAKELDLIIFPISQENDEGKTAESKGLARDADFWFSVSKPSRKNRKNIKVKKNGVEYSVEVDDSLFLITLKEARHVASGWSFIGYLRRNGEFVEYDVEHSEMFQAKTTEYLF